ncbi:MAG: diguanylate cyclase [Clostridia bacterium]
MIQNIITLYLFAAVLVTSFLVTYMLSRSRNAYMKAFAFLNFFISIYLLGYMMEINTSGFEKMIFWNQIQYFAIPFVPTLWFLVAITYNKRRIRRGYLLAAGLFLVPGITFLVRLTNAFHQLYYTSYEIIRLHGFELLEIGKGPFYYLHAAYALVMLIGATLVFMGEFRRSRSHNRRKTGLILIASCIPYVGLGLIVFAWGLPALDYTALLFPLTVGILVISIFRYDFLELRSLARETTFENSNDGMILMDPNGNIMDYNKAARDFFLLAGKEMEPGSMDEIFRGGHELLEALNDFSPREYTMALEEGARHFSITSTPMGDRHAGLLKTIREITDRVRIEEQLRYYATMDEMSGLYGRRHFMELAQQEYLRAKRYKNSFCVILLDVDEFKFVNDSFGHAAGDVVIRELGTLIRSRFRNTDVLGRLGGEEFCILLPNSSAYISERIAEEFRRNVSSMKIFHERTFLSITVSVGLACFQEEDTSFEDILIRADKAMYEAKKAGKNRTVIICRDS